MSVGRDVQVSANQMMLVLVYAQNSVQHRFSKIPACQYPAIHSDILNSPQTLSDYMHVHIILLIIWCAPLFKDLVIVQAWQKREGELILANSKSMSMNCRTKEMLP